MFSWIVVWLALLGCVYGRVCVASNASDTPASSGCVWCDINATGAFNGCYNNGTCYQSSSGPVCGCYLGYAPPTCFSTAPVPPICNPSNGSQVPPSCTYCDPTQPQGRQGCLNGGTCYYRSVTGFPPPGLALCGCSYEWQPPSCAAPTTRTRICDPTVVTDTPPACQFCYPGEPVQSNGCLNLGLCLIQNFSGTVAGQPAPPNFQLALCACQGSLIPPQCLNNYFYAFDALYLIQYRWVFVAGSAVIIVLSLVVISQHLYFAYFYKFTNSNKTKLFSSVLVLCSAICYLIYLSINPSGLVKGFPDVYSLIAQELCVMFTVAFLVSCVAINTSTWIWIALSAVSPLRNTGDRWPLISRILSYFVMFTIFFFGILFSCWQLLLYNVISVYFYMAAAYIIVMCLFSVISGLIVLATIKDIENADPKLLSRTAAQLVILCSLELIGGVLLIVIEALPQSVYTSATVLFGISLAFSSCVLFLIQGSLLIQCRIAVWQLKEVALTRGNTGISGTATSASVRKKENSYADVMSSEMGLTKDTPVSDDKKDISLGVVSLR